MIEPAAAPGADPGIAAAAAALDLEDTPVPSSPAGPFAVVDGPREPIDWKAEARALWTIVSALKYRFPSVGKVLTPAALDDLAAAWAPVLERHKFDGGKWMIYVVAGATTLPVLGELYVGIGDDRAAERAADAKPIDATATSSSGETIKTPVHDRPDREGPLEPRATPGGANPPL